MMWPATTGSPWSARRPRVRRRKQHHRGSAPAGRDSSLSRILPYLRAFLLALYLDGSNTEPHKSSLFTSSISVSLTSLQSLGIAIYSIFIVYWKIHLYKPNVSYFLHPPITAKKIPFQVRDSRLAQNVRSMWEWDDWNEENIVCSAWKGAWLVIGGVDRRQRAKQNHMKLKKFWTIAYLQRHSPLVAFRWQNNWFKDKLSLAAIQF